MLSRAVIVALAGASALCLATSAYAAAESLALPRPAVGLAKPRPALAKPRPGVVAAKAKPAAAPEIEVAYQFPIYDSVVDPLTAAIRQALANAGTEGSFLDKRDAAAVAEYYAEQGYAPSWTADGKLTDRAKAIVASIGKAADEVSTRKPTTCPTCSLAKRSRRPSKGSPRPTCF